jgi:hypothetical protein
VRPHSGVSSTAITPLGETQHHEEKDAQDGAQGAQGPALRFPHRGQPHHQQGDGGSLGLRGLPPHRRPRRRGNGNVITVYRRVPGWNGGKDTQPVLLQIGCESHELAQWRDRAEGFIRANVGEPKVVAPATDARLDVAGITSIVRSGYDSVTVWDATGNVKVSVKLTDAELAAVVKRGIPALKDAIEYRGGSEASTDDSRRKTSAPIAYVTLLALLDALDALTFAAKPPAK